MRPHAAQLVPECPPDQRRVRENTAAEGDPHRDSGYTLFYMGINLGALLAGLLMAWAARLWGWHNCFYLSSAGMALGLAAMFALMNIEFTRK